MVLKERLELGTFEETRDGVPLKFRVTTIPPELVKPVVKHMVDYFMAREPMMSHFKLKDDPASLEACEKLWENAALTGASLVAIREGPEEEKDRIVGANITYVTHKGSQKPDIVKGTKLELVYDAVVDAAERAKMYEKYGEDTYLSAFGLSVSPDYHGYKIGERLLQCRKPLCKHLGIKFTGTVYTHPKSMHLSKKVGFKVLYEDDLSTFKHNGEIVFKGGKGKFEQSAWDFSEP